MVVKMASMTAYNLVGLSAGATVVLTVVLTGVCLVVSTAAVMVVMKVGALELW